MQVTYLPPTLAGNEKQSTRRRASKKFGTHVSFRYQRSLSVERHFSAVIRG